MNLSKGLTLIQTFKGCLKRFKKLSDYFYYFVECDLAIFNCNKKEDFKSNILRKVWKYLLLNVT